MATYEEYASWNRPILEVLAENRVFSISKSGHEMFLIEELCDTAFGVVVKKDELIALADEIKALAEAE